METINYTQPYIINFPTIGSEEEGYISVSELDEGLPFKVERTFWTYHVPSGITRGRHAHYTSEQLLFAIHSEIRVKTETPDGKSSEFHLKTPNQGLYIPPHVWRTIDYSKDAVQLVLSSTKYDETDYIRSYQRFLDFWSA